MTAGPSQGLNLGGRPEAYGDSFVALDLVKGLAEWEYYNGTEGVALRPDQLQMDAEGWLTDMPLVNGAVTEIYANLFYGTIIGPTQYIMEWKGEGSVSAGSDFTVIGRNKILINFQPDYLDDAGNPQQDGLSIVLKDTDPRGTGNHIRDIQLYRVEDADLVAAGERFNPDWFDRVDDFRVLRTHDWQSTNFPDQVEWTRNVETADQANWGLAGRGMPYELLVQMANETRSDLWINIPHTASDDFMRAAAAYVKANLDPGLRVMVEFSNEYWTTIFDQYQYFLDGGEAAFGNADFAAAQFYATRAVVMADIFAAEFGPNSARLRPTLTLDSAMFSTGEAEAMLTAPDHVAAGGAAPVGQGFDVLATDGYLSWYGPDPETRDMILGWMTQGDGGFAAARDFLLDQLYTDLLPNWQKGRVLADQYGLQFMIYEGGALLLNNGAGADDRVTGFNIRFSGSEELRDVYAAMEAAWQTVGTGPFAWYADVGRPGPWGDYGHWKGIDFIPDPRTGVITDSNADVPPWWQDADDPRTDASFANGTYDAGEAGQDAMTGTALRDRLYGLAGDDTLTGYSGDDRLWAGTGRDQIAGGRGADEVNGGLGRDTADYGSSAAGVTLRLSSGRGSGGDAEGDRLSGVENLRGSGFDDRLFGDGAVNVLWGGAGKDWLSGGAGKDHLTGGAGADSFVYLAPGDGGDRISDFNRDGGDVIRLLAAGFGNAGRGELRAEAFQSALGVDARSDAVRILHDRRTDTIWYDADGAGSGAAVLLARLQTDAVVGVADFIFF